jgi:2-polyprenyl-6-hydroxyphenyl methylase/3-demethylubiquinone-9 3-methyltransferase
MSKSWCDYQNPGELLEAYLEANDNLYARMKGKAIERALQNHLPSLEGKMVADVGAGGGIWTRFWLQQGARVTALDKQSHFLAANKMMNPEAKCVEGDATTVDLGDKFDIIFTKDLIEHIPDDEAFLQNMARHLKDEGYLILITQNSFSLGYVIEGFYNRYYIGNRSWCGWDPTHVRFYNFRQLNRKLKICGFVPLEYWSTYHFPYRFLTKLFFRRLIEWKGFQFVDLMKLNKYLPFSVSGWSIGVIARKSAIRVRKNEEMAGL